ncbi:MAG: GerW family sporulation protein [Firmicutes bacterium]|nr:GerW family sporulation protein [Bacillota bacterium]
MANRNESLKDLLNQMEGFVSTKSVIGEPMTLNDMVILPLLDVSLGAGAGARDREKAGGLGGAVSAKMSPSAVLVIKDGQVRIVNIKNQDTVTKALDMVPDILDRFKPARRAEDAVIVETVKSQESEKPAED